MKAKHLLSLLLLAAVPLASRADQLVPAGSVINCTVSEKISSQTEHVGDAVLCQLGHTEVYGRTTFPYGSYLVGHFAEYKDPGHFVGKGWMELVFDKMIVQPDTTVPVNVRVVATPGYKVDDDGRIHGNGHPVKDTVTWLIPVLWPLDLINLPRRGPRPVLKPETRLTLRVMDDFGIPTPMENAVRTPALISRQTPDEPTYQSYRQQAPPAYQQPAYQPPPRQAYAPQPQYAPQPMYQQPVYQQPVYVPAPQVVVVQSAPVVVQQSPVVVQQSPVVVQQAPPVYYRHYGYPY